MRSQRVVSRLARSSDLTKAVLLGALVALFAGIVKSRNAHLDSVDAQAMYDVAKGLVDQGTPLIRPVIPPFFTGRTYSPFGLGTSLLMAPAQLISDQLVVRINAVLLGAIAAVQYLTARALRLSAIWVCMASLALAVGTFLFTYGVANFAECAVALTVAAGLFALTLPDGAARGLVLGSAVGLSVLFRSDSALLVALPLGMALVVASRWRTAIVASIAAAPWLVLWGWYNAARYGSPVSTDYPGSTGFTGSPLYDLAALVISPTKGFIFFAPIVILAALGFPTALRRWPLWTWTALALFLPRFVFYAFYGAWAGGLAFGPRYLAPAVPALMIPLAPVIERAREEIGWRIAVCAFALVGFGVAMIGAASLGTWVDGRSPYEFDNSPVVLFVENR